MTKEALANFAFPQVSGIPGSTLIPNEFFEFFFPSVEFIEDIFTLFWCVYVLQEEFASKQKYYVSSDDLWFTQGVEYSFKKIGIDKEQFNQSLERCVGLGFLLKMISNHQNHEEVIFLLNNSTSQDMVTNLQTGESNIDVNLNLEQTQTFGTAELFQLYEEYFGVISPRIAESLVEASNQYDSDLIKQALKEASTQAITSWRYIERILESKEKESRKNETNRRDSLEARKHNYIGGKFGHLAKYR